MANYNVFYSDPGKTTPIVVVDGTLNQTDTSLKLAGQNYPGYGPALSEDLVHLLENFASSSPPNNPIEGQLWFNTSDPLNKKLLLNDGSAHNAVWSPVNGVHQSAFAPTNASIGDIWVDTNQQQMYIWNGSTFILVGPNYAGSSKTGPYATTSTDLAGLSHNIVINYVNGNAIEIVSADSFTPLQSIDGFSSIKTGVNVTNKNFGTTQSPLYATFNGTANAAKGLLQSSSTSPVTADAFARTDIPETFHNPVTFNTDQGFSIGTDPTFTIQRQNQYDATFLNTYGSKNTSGGRFVFRAIKNNINSPIVVIDGNSNRVGINTQIPAADLDVAGSFNVSGDTSVETLVVQSSRKNTSATGSNALVVNGGAGIGGTLVVTGEHVLFGPLTIGSGQIFTSTDSTSVLNPTTSTVQYSIGGPNVYWNKVYAVNYVGANGGPATFTGNATSAGKLSRTSDFLIQGALESYNPATNNQAPESFNGLSDVTFNTRAHQDFVYKVKGGSTSTTKVSDQLVIYRQAVDQFGANVPDTGASGNGTLLKQQKSDFLADLYEGLITTGCVMPFAGPASYSYINDYSNNQDYPALYGKKHQWLVCDGTSYKTTDYPALFAMIQYTYGGSGTSFSVPDLRNQGLASPSPTNPSAFIYMNYIIKT